MTTQTQTTTPAERAFYHCPDWCQRFDHDADVVNFEHPPIHYGPEWEHVFIQGEDTARLVANVRTDTAEVDHDPASLRRIAADLLAAAEWLEARR